MSLSSHRHPDHHTIHIYSPLIHCPLSALKKGALSTPPKVVILFGNLSLCPMYYIHLHIHPFIFSVTPLPLFYLSPPYDSLDTQLYYLPITTPAWHTHTHTEAPVHVPDRVCQKTDVITAFIKVIINIAFSLRKNKGAPPVLSIT